MIKKKPVFKKKPAPRRPGKPLSKPLSKLTAKPEAAKPAPRPQGQPSPAERLAIAAAQAAFDKKGFDVLVLDVREKSPVTEMMVIASCRSTTHLRAVSANVEAELLKLGFKASHRDRGIGGDTDWMLLDFFDVMVHLFVNDVRGHYQLERLYDGCPTVAQFH